MVLFFLGLLKQVFKLGGFNLRELATGNVNKFLITIQN